MCWKKILISDEGYRLLKPVNAKEFKNIPRTGYQRHGGRSHHSPRNKK
jgi:hypothetical protein